MKDRIKKLRKNLDMTQQVFADRLGVKRNTVAQWEIGINALTDQSIISICREFNVNEDWLRNGTEPMFIPIDKGDQLMEWAGKIFAGREDSFRQRFVRMMMELSEDDWKTLEKKARWLVENEKELGD